MTSNHNTRLIIIIAIIISFVSIAGSAWLNRIIYRADEPSLSTSLIVESNQVSVNDQVRVSVITSSADRALLFGAQYELNYNTEQLQFMAFENSADWQTSSSTIEPGVIRLLLLPTDQTTYSIAAGHQSY